MRSSCCGTARMLPKMKFGSSLWPTVPRTSTRGGCSSSNSCRSRSEEHTSELQSLRHLVCRLLLEKKNKKFEIRKNTEIRMSFRLLPVPLFSKHLHRAGNDDYRYHIPPPTHTTHMIQPPHVSHHDT